MCQNLAQMTMIVTQNLHHVRTYRRFWTEQQIVPTHFSHFLVSDLGENTWYVSEFGSDDNDCHSESAPCKNLQTVLSRATDGADIYVTSRSLLLDGRHRNYFACTISSPLSYTISHLYNTSFTFSCSGLCANLALVIVKHLGFSKDELL